MWDKLIANNSTIIQVVGILVGAYTLHFLAKAGIRNTIKRLNDRGHDTTKVKFIKNSLGFIIYTIAITMIAMLFPSMRLMGGTLLASAGIIATIVGFASREAFANIINGVFIVIFKPFQIDDTIEFPDGLKGIVTDITFRHTVIKDFENRQIIIPNMKIAENTIINSSFDEEKIRKQINFSVAYESNEDLAIEIIRKTIETHPLCLDNRTEEDIKENKEKVQVVMTAWLDSAVNLRAYVWTENNANAFKLTCDVLAEIKKKFKENNIQIPYPQLQIHQNK